MSNPRVELRRQMRQQRRALSATERRAAADALAARVLAQLELRGAQRIAAYLANDGEIDPAPLVQALWRLGKTVYLPMLHPYSAGRLLFGEYRPDTPLKANRFGINEPQLCQARRCPPWALDWVLTPLVAFDAQGHRLGMGGGFYDRTFAFMQREPAGPGPRLLGLAYEFQRVATLEQACWDVPVHAIASPVRLYR